MNANSGASSDYDVANANGDVTPLTSGQTINVGNRFQVYYNNIAHNKAQFKIIIDGDKEFSIYMQGQSSSNAGSPGRYRMHYVLMSVPKELKCYTCGLCGDFVIRTTGFKTESMEACDGSLINYRAGWKFPSTPEAFDTYGWTWEKLYTDNECSNNYDNTDNMLRNTPIVDACDATIEQQVINECDAAIAAQQTCCDKIGNGVCDGLKEDCYIDACAGANGDVTAIDDEIQNIIIDPITAVCNNDDLIDNQPLPDPLDFSCVVRDGNSVKAVGAISSASCQAGEVLASCGIAGTHLIEGTYVDPAEPNKCQAQTMSGSYAVKAKAVCCTFTGVTATASTVTSTTMNGNSQGTNIVSGLFIYKRSS